MSIEANFERGYQLFELGRYKDAIPYFKQSLSANVDNFEAKYFLAQCFYLTNDSDKAKTLALELRSIQPNFSHVYLLLSRIELSEDNLNEALSNIDMAISLNPYDEDQFGQKSYILLQKKKYYQALDMADEGLKINPKSEFCLNARATALTKLNRKEEVKETIDNLLNDNPDNAYSHANVGWSYLENNNAKKALEHFRESLKLYPNSELARSGMLAAIKSKNKVYNLYLQYSFWIGKKSEKNQWFFIIGLYLVYRFSIKILSATGLSIIAVPLLIIYLLFALGSWIMEPLSNMILLFDKFGKYLLDKDDRLSGQIFFGLLLSAILFFSLSFIINNDYFLLISITCLTAILPLSRSPLLISKNGKLFGYTYGILMLLVAIIGTAIGYGFGTLAITIAVMFIAYTWIGNLF